MSWIPVRVLLQSNMLLPVGGNRPFAESKDSGQRVVDGLKKSVRIPEYRRSPSMHYVVRATASSLTSYRPKT